MAPRISSSNGPCLAFEPRGHVIPKLPPELLSFADRIDREADAAAAEGRFAVADRLSIIAITARGRATGARA